jgi:hypothetical protein
MSNPIGTILQTMVVRLHAERLETEAWQTFREAAQRGDPTLTLEQCDAAWYELKKKAERMYQEERGAKGAEAKP